MARLKTRSEPERWTKAAGCHSVTKKGGHRRQKSYRAVPNGIAITSQPSTRMSAGTAGKQSFTAKKLPQKRQFFDLFLCNSDNVGFRVEGDVVGTGLQTEIIPSLGGVLQIGVGI